MRRADGQGTIEYVAVVALVAAVLVVGGLAAAPGVANAVGRALARAVCQVAGRGCRVFEPPGPCTVRSTTYGGAVTAKLAVLRVGADAAIVRAERSDGSVDVTLLDQLAGGVAAVVGARGGVRLGGAEVGAGVAAEAQLVAALGGGRTWRLRSRAEADRFTRRLAEVLAGRGASAVPGVGRVLDLGQRILHRGAHAALPEPDSTLVTGGLRGEVTAQLGPVPGAHGTLGGVVGRRRARDGTTTWLVRLAAELAVPLGQTVGLRAAGAGEASLTVAVGPDGAWRTLTVTAVGTLAPRGDGLPVLGATLSHGSAGRVSVTGTLDLSDSSDRALARAVLVGLSPRGAARLPGAVAALADAIGDHAALDVAAYRDGRTAAGVEVEAGLGAGAGVSAELSRARSRLVGAWSRPPGGVWERRLDCVA